MITPTTICGTTASVRAIGHESLRLYRLNPITFQADDCALDAAAVDAAIAQEEYRDSGPLVGAMNGAVITVEIVAVVVLLGCMSGFGNDVEVVCALAVALACALFLCKSGRGMG